VYALNVPKTCSDCHERVRIVEKYGIPAMRMTSYLSSYHGLASKAGNIEAANCSSCHDTHKILPSSDPDASINKNNLPKTCGHCHVGIAAGGQIDSIHEFVDKRVEYFNKLVTLIYLILIGLTVGGMFVYCTLDFIKKVRERDSWCSIYDKEENVANIKFNLVERLMHQLLLVFFIILVYTGFAHHFPENPLFTWFVQWKTGYFRAIIHRIAGTGLLVLFLVQLNLMVFTRRGRKQTVALLPNFKDPKEAITLLFYNLGLIKQRPKLTHPFSFIEKFEFWALLWGNIIMAGTGLLLWFTDISLSFIPKWVLDIFLIIHYYEAILASLAILIWHLYWSIFDPVVYPYNPVIFTAKVPKAVAVEKHDLK
jgi:cytochrome b subunit of formate dehydrogenase